MSAELADSVLLYRPVSRPPATWSTRKAAAYVGVHPGSFARLAHAHGLQGTRTGRVTDWPPDGIAELLAARSAQ